MKTHLSICLMIVASLVLISGFVVNFRTRKGPVQIYQGQKESRPTCIWIFLLKWKHMLKGSTTMAPPSMEPTDGDGSEDGGDMNETPEPEPEPEQPEPEAPTEAEELVKAPNRKKGLKKPSTPTSAPEMSISVPESEAPLETEQDLVRVPIRSTTTKRPGISTTTTAPEIIISESEPETSSQAEDLVEKFPKKPGASTTAIGPEESISDEVPAGDPFISGPGDKPELP